MYLELSYEKTTNKVVRGEEGEILNEKQAKQLRKSINTPLEHAKGHFLGQWRWMTRFFNITIVNKHWIDLTLQATANRLVIVPTATNKIVTKLLLEINDLDGYREGK